MTEKLLVEPGDQEWDRETRAQTVEGLLALIEEECFHIMEQAGLPTYYGSYLFRPGGEWCEMSIDRVFEGWRIANEIQPIARAAGHDYDSIVGFAARMLGDTVWCRRSREKGDHDRAAMHLHWLGVRRAELRLKLKAEPDWERGRATRVGASQGNAARTRALSLRNEQIADAYRRRREQAQDRPTALRYTAKDFGLSSKQVGRIVGKD